MTGPIATLDLDPQAFLRHGAGRGAVLLLHGFPGNPGEMRPLARSLHQAGWTVSGPALPGLEGSASAPELAPRAEDWLQAVAEAHDSLAAQHETTVLLGYSMGAALALIEAVRRPPVHLVLVAPFHHSGTAVRDLLRPALRWLPRRFRPRDASTTAAGAGATQPSAAPEPRAESPTDTSEGAGTEISGILVQVRRIGRRAYDLAPRISSPTLVIQGQSDELAPPDRVRQLLDRLGGPQQLASLQADHALLRPDAPTWSAFERLILTSLNAPRQR